MFGNKKRLFRNDVSKAIVGLAVPPDIETATTNVYQFLQKSIKSYYSQNMYPMQAAMLISYEFIQNLVENKDDPSTTEPVNEFKELFVAAALAIVAENGPGDLMSSESQVELKKMLEVLKPCLVFSYRSETFENVLNEASNRQKMLRQHKETKLNLTKNRI